MKRIGLVLVGVTALTLLVAFLVSRAHRNERTPDRPRAKSDAPQPGPRQEDLPTRIDGTKIRSSPREATPKTGTLNLYAHAGGRPVGRCQVILYNEPLEIRLRAQTDETGTLIAEKLPVGEWEIGARHPKFIPVEIHVDVAEGRTAEARLELKEGGRIFGLITDTTGRPVPGARVYLLNEKEMNMGPLFHTRAGERGEYVIEGVPTGMHGVSVDAPRYRNVWRMGVTFTAAGQSAQLDVTLETGTFVSGVVTDEGGVPIAKAALTAGAVGEPSGNTEAETDGTFSITTLGDKPFNMSASARGYGTVYLHDIAPNTAGLQIRLPRCGTISGTVAADGPLEGFTVVLSWWDDYWKMEQVLTSGSFRNAGTGAFELKNVGPGAYTIWAEARGYVPAERVPVVVQRGAATEGIPLRLIRK